MSKHPTKIQEVTKLWALKQLALMMSIPLAVVLFYIYLSHQIATDLLKELKEV